MQSTTSIDCQKIDATTMCRCDLPPNNKQIVAQNADIGIKPSFQTILAAKSINR